MKFENNVNKSESFVLLQILEGAARYAGLLLAPAEGFGLGPRPFFLPFGQKNKFLCLFLVIFGFLKD